MKILFSSHSFLPKLGGLESVSAILAEQFVSLGHEVRLITQTAESAGDRYPYEIVRRPGMRALFQLSRWCDVIFHNNISLPRAWPVFVLRKPWVVAHHVWIPTVGISGRLKHALLRYATGISISGAIAEHIATPSTIIPNPYDDSTFRLLPGIARDKDLVFLGRLVSDKGVSLLLSALASLRLRGLRPRLTIIGSGPEEPSLRATSRELDLDNQVEFAGSLAGTELAEALNSHRIMVVPSIWREPFGIVALEGMACGCVPVGSNAGGLRDAIGECGVVFDNGHLHGLTNSIEALLRSEGSIEQYRGRAPAHLARHRPADVAREYLRVLGRAAGKHV